MPTLRAVMNVYTPEPKKLEGYARKKFISNRLSG